VTGSARARPREALRSAQVDAQRARVAADGAARIADRSRANMEREGAAIAEHRGLGARIAAWGAARLKAGANTTAGALPADLARDRAALAEATERQADAEAVHAVLMGEVAACADQADAARAGLDAAVDAVMVADLLALVDAMRQADAEAGRLRALVSAMGSVRTGADAPLPWKAQQVAHDPAHAHLIDLAAPGAMPAAASAWSAYRAALLEDANASAPA